jgi:hypothetical protein
MTGICEYELFWGGDPIGRLINAEPDVPYVEGIWQSNGSEAALRFAAVISEVFDAGHNVHWSMAPQVEVLHANGQRSKGFVTGSGESGLFIRW